MKDKKSGSKINKKLAENDKGDGTVTLDQFSKVMTSFKIKDGLLQTAIAQIAYVSQDLNHLNYNLFLKRFDEVEQ